LARTALLVAGGTGGHLFPALALREVLVARGWDVHVATDPRVSEFIENVPATKRHRVPSASIAGRSPIALARAFGLLAKGYLVSRALLRGVRPNVVIGFGGYPTVPPVLAARAAKIPILVHEANAVLGRANRLLVRFGALLASGFEKPKGAERAREIVHVGNPVRQAISAAVRPYQPSEGDQPFSLLVFGGSQGARVFSQLVPAALAELPPEKRRRMRVAQQARPEELAATRAAFRDVAAEAAVDPFFSDMGERLATAHLVICRAGASTVAELAVAGRPAILVPYPHALDHDQAENARALAEAGGGWLMPEADLTAALLARRIAALMDWPEQLQEAAEAARAQGRLDAAERLADLVERAAR
jgi:UDP-N-acetylglucosamine--N-acetylmuramyl-(pentapeptide) pyrophosphoryl-undecaprenol N-acetylglucosamine transferase